MGCQPRDSRSRQIGRRDFLGMGVVGGGAMVLGGRLASAEAGGAKTDVWVLHGTDKQKMMQAAWKIITDNGGLGKDVKKLTLKVNAAWWRTPQQAANTNPQLVDAFLKGCKDRGVKQIVMPEHPVDAAKNSFPRSGLLGVAKSNGVPMIDMRAESKLFKETQLPHAKKLKTAAVCSHFLQTDAIVNMPVAKHHGSTGLTMAMKNWMGAVQDRRFFHRNDLNQCIADISGLLKPNWTIVDAFSIMLDRGPKGPAKTVKTPNMLIVSKDQVAADAYTATLFPDALAAKAKYLQLAAAAKTGVADVSQLAIHKMEIS